MPRWAAAVLCVLGAALLVAGYHMWRAGLATEGYTRTRGRVVRAVVEESPRTSEAGEPRFRPVVRYAFEARGRTYESERISVGANGSESWDEQAARRIVERYPAGAEVEVWFDPHEPGRSVLARGIPRAEVVIAVALGLALAGIGMFFLAR